MTSPSPDDAHALLKQIDDLKLSNEVSHEVSNVLDVGWFAKRLEEAKRVIVMLGAGASTSCGIPDFRTPQSKALFRTGQGIIPWML